MFVQGLSLIQRDDHLDSRTGPVQRQVRPIVHEALVIFMLTAVDIHLEAGLVLGSIGVDYLDHDALFLERTDDAAADIAPPLLGAHESVRAFQTKHFFLRIQGCLLNGGQECRIGPQLLLKGKDSLLNLSSIPSFTYLVLA
ncbi:hypothetical protein [Lysobacter capsici]|uniref:hypothetical protein n=1 Tax=Lysobacter capsici TaxID=435897 RepID=UPI0011DF9C93|nr:hypothetical protein [Lysobacter capsici]